MLLRELLDYIDQQYVTAGDRPSARLTYVHPLQPFSPRNYRDEPRSYDGDWCAVAQALQPPTRPEPAEVDWNRTRLSDLPDPLRTVGFLQLLRFVRHPVRFFVNTRLQIYLREEAPGEDDEAFGLDALQSFSLRRRLLDDYLKGRPTPALQLSAEGLLPHGAFAALALQQESQIVQPLTRRLEAFRESSPEQRLVDLFFEDEAAGSFRLAGQIKGIYPGPGLLRYRPGVLKGPDILALWLEHLAWCAAEGGGDKSSTLHGTTGRFTLTKTLAPAEAQAHLARYLRWYREGLQRPLPLLPGASYAWMRTVSQGGRADPSSAAFTAWNGNDFSGIPGDKDDPYVQLVMRGVSGRPIDQPEFTELAAAFYAEALDSGEYS